MATLSSSSSSSPHLRLILLRRPPTPPFLRSFLTSETKHSFTPLRTTPFLTPSRSSFRSLFSSLAPPPCSLSHQLAESDVVSPQNATVESENETALLFAESDAVSLQNATVESENVTAPDDVVSLESENGTAQLVAESDAVSLQNAETESGNETNSTVADVDKESLGNSYYYGAAKAPPPSLSVKEKKELASYAHSLGKKLKSQQVGKSGVTDTVVMALGETLEKRELLKLKIHGNCPGELEDVVKELEKATGSVVVGQIGRTVILYRPSLTKLEAEEKKKQAQKIYLKRQSASRQSLSQSRRPSSVPGEAPRQYGRVRQGISRY